MTVLLFGTYDVRAHPRVAVLRDGLRASGVPVTECNVPLRLDTAARVRLLAQPWRLPLLGWRLLACWTALSWRARPLPVPDVVVVGYLGHFDVHLARRRFAESVVVLDHLVSAAGTATDRGASGRLLSRALRLLDRSALRQADIVVVDTEEHLAALPAEAQSRAVVVPVGATEDWFAAAPSSQPAAPLRAVFVGLFTPLQGTIVLADALRQLGPSLGVDVTVTLVGDGQDAAAVRERVAGLRGVTWHEWIDGSALPALVAAHDVALGIFGTTPKALAVVPTKVFQGAAAGCAIVTSDTPPQRRALADAPLYVPAGDPAALAATLRDLAADGELLARHRAASRRVAEAFRPATAVAPLVAALPASRTSVARPPASATDRAGLPPLSATAALRWAAVERLLPEAADGVLDVGCGQAAIGVRLAARFPGYVGLEPDPQSAAVARDRLAAVGGGEVRTATVAQLDPDERFDLLCAFEVLEHIEEDAAALREWLGHVRPAGTVLVSVPGYQRRFSDADRLVGHVRRYEPATLQRLLVDAGCVDVGVRHYGFPIGYVHDTARARMAARRLARGPQRSREEATAESGRLLQPGSGWFARAYAWSAVPFLRVQHRFPDRGTTLLARGRLPAPVGVAAS